MISQKDLAVIETGGRKAIEALWQKKLPSIALPPLNLRTLRKALAFEIQMTRTTALSPQAKQILQACEPKVTSTRLPQAKDKQSQPNMLAPGTVLVREWNGRRYQVTVQAGEFEMDGRTYKSLTRVAKAITGTHWSGPRFFGLSKAKKKKVGEV